MKEGGGGCVGWIRVVEGEGGWWRVCGVDKGGGGCGVDKGGGG